MTPMPDMNVFARRCHIASEAKGWTNLKRTDAQTINLMISENSEALEDFRNKRGVTEIYYQVKMRQEGSSMVVEKEVSWGELQEMQKLDGKFGRGGILLGAKPCGIPIEIADTIIRIGQQCGTHELNLQEAMLLTETEVFMRKDLNEALADSTLHLSAAWRASKQFDPQGAYGGAMVQVQCFARALWSLLHFCESAGIDAWKAVEEKMAYNDTRPMLHGGKAI